MVCNSKFLNIKKNIYHTIIFKSLQQLLKCSSFLFKENGWLENTAKVFELKFKFSMYIIYIKKKFKGVLFKNETKPSINM